MIMVRRLLGLTLLGVAAMILLVPAGPASAAYLYDWSSVQQYTDSTNDAPYSPTSGQNILTAWHAYDGTYHYFRIDLASAPSSTFPPGYANTYGIYIDSRAGGAPNGNEYIPGTLTGIDFIVSSEVELENNNRLDWDKELQRWKVDEFKHSDDLTFQHGENGGTTLEWRIRDGEGEKYIGNSFAWWAATMLPGDDGQAKITYDVMATPIPASAWLLGSGLIALVGLKRRRSVKA